ncbi:MAG: replication-relaxation family protein [Actinobacteria bacterium]|nr:replication-relaxation family protein [Actinomycetota bacterium]
MTITQSSDEAGGNPVETPFENPVAKPPAPGEARHVGTHRRVSAGQATFRPKTTGIRLPKDSSVLRSPTRRACDDIRWAITQRLTERDRLILHDVERFRVLTTPQVTRLHFGSLKRAAARLLHLHELAVLDRFRPRREPWGAHPWHWVVGPLGAAILAGEAGDDPERASRRWRGERTIAYSTGQRLAHLIGINEIYASLASCPEGSLLDWQTEAEATKWSWNEVRPDGWGIWEQHGRRAEFFLEYDRGTETLSRLVEKLPNYDKVAVDRGTPTWVLFAFTSARREQTARRALADATVPIATAALLDGIAPHDAVWLPLRGADGRLPLAGLADVPMPPEALERAATGGHRAWHYER